MARTSKIVRRTSRNSASNKSVSLLVGTRKGAWVFRSDPTRRSWKVQGPIFLGSIINHFVADPRSGTMLMAAKTGHLGPTIFRSVDLGKTWRESTLPPQFEKSKDGLVRSVSHTFWLSPGHECEKGVWWAGTSPPGLFVSTDDGVTWQSVDGFNDHELYTKWCPADGGTPDGALLNQILIDPRDARHMYIATSTGGVFESLDRGKTWCPLNENVEANFLPDPFPEFGQDAHYIALSPTNPDRLWQQNHCGIYKVDRPKTRWTRIGASMPKDVGDIGFTILAHPHDENRAWVFPMDGTDAWPRTSPMGRPAAYVTQDAGKSWKRLDRGFPRKQAWFTVKRQAFCRDDFKKVGLYLGTTGGEIWSSLNEGGKFSLIASHLPEIYSVDAVSFA